MSSPVVLGILADLHGDFEGFYRALRIFERERVVRVICAGDVVDRGMDADRIIPVLQKLKAICVKGNHEITVARSQSRWRKSERSKRLAQVGRIISDETLAFIEDLPATARLEIAQTRILIAHGAPWSDLTGIFPDSRQSTFDQLYERYHQDTDVIILGHTHRPMHARKGALDILNPGSVYGITARDSHSCATLRLPTREYRVFDLRSGERIDVPLTVR